MFQLLYDANGEKQVVNATGLYVGEEGPDINPHEWVEEKRTVTAEVAESLEGTNDSIQKRKEELDKANEKDGTLSEVLGDPLAKKGPKRQKKRARESEAAKTIMETIETADPKEFSGRRVAKYFDTDVFFGNVTYIPVKEGPAMWHIEYDDGDEEDFECEELKNGLLLYIEKQKLDPENKAKKQKK
ncbi:MAG: hypothetical protein SGARI_006905 [Bacillariaceae sp.]